MNPLFFVSTLIFLVTISFATNAQTPLQGKLKNVTLDQSKSPYIVSANIQIERGDTVHIKKGVILLFGDFTGLEVFGSLFVEGTEKEPVIFTSVNDSKYNPQSEKFAQAFDWNGISVDLRSEDVVMHHFKLCYSVYGIKSYNGRMVIKNGIFTDNGQYNLVINETIQDVTNGTPFSYNYKEPTRADSLKGGVRPLTPYEQKLLNKRVLVFSSLGMGIIAGGLGGYFGNQWVVSSNNYEHAPLGAPYKDLENTFKRNRVLAITTGSLSVAFLTTSLVIQLIPIKLTAEQSASVQSTWMDNVSFVTTPSSIAFSYAF